MASSESEIEVEVMMDDLCEVYGCDRCPGRVARDGETIFCNHDCHCVADCDA